MTSPVRFAILGCGRMGQHHAQLLARDPRAQVVAVFDPNRTSAERIAAAAPGAIVAVSIEELWTCDNLDAVVLCTPTREHFAQATAALHRGCHVLCEKPLATAAEDMTQLIAIGQQARLKGQQFSIGYQRRHWGTFRTLRRAVQSEQWGPVRAVSVHAVEAWQQTIAGTWRDDPLQNPGGFLGDAGSHKLDMLFYLTGLPARQVFARSWNRGSRVEIVSSVAAVFGDDVPVTLDFIGDGQHLGEDWHLHCAHADLVLRTDRLWISRGNQTEPLDVTEPHAEPVTSFLDTICHGAEDRAPAECAWPVYQLTQAIRESSASRRVIEVPE